MPNQESGDQPPLGGAKAGETGCVVRQVLDVIGQQVVQEFRRLRPAGPDKALIGKRHEDGSVSRRGQLTGQVAQMFDGLPGAKGRRKTGKILGHGCSPGDLGIKYYMAYGYGSSKAFPSAVFSLRLRVCRLAGLVRLDADSVGFIAPGLQ